MVANAETKFCRNVTALANPHAAAIRSTLQVVVSRRARAESRRRMSTHLGRVVPVVSRNRRLKLRRLMQA